MATLAPIQEEQQEMESVHDRRRPLKGTDGVISLVDQFHALATGNNKWPVTNDQWLMAQQDDLYWRTILNKINEKGYCLIIKNTEEYVDYITREVLDDDENLGPLIRRTNITKKMTHSNRVLSYVEEIRQMIIPTD